jgi:hypothetical protein
VLRTEVEGVVLDFCHLGSPCGLSLRVRPAIHGGVRTMMDAGSSPA